MTTGTLSSGMCFYTQGAAARHECSMMARQGNTGMTCVDVSPVSETAGGAVSPTFSQRWQVSGSTSTTPTSIVVPLQACEVEDYWPWPLSVQDGTLIAVAVASVWLTAVAWRFVRRSQS